MPRPATLSILFQDDDLIAVEKPAGLATIPGRGESSSLIEVLAAQVGLPFTGSTDPRLRIVHRLDKDTSGVLLFTKHVAAQRRISEQFQHNRVMKEYLALVIGSPPDAAGTIDAALAPHPTSPKRMAVAKRGRHALTEWIAEQRFRGFALLRCFPKTGRTHQIRVHLAHVGMPLAIDPLYRRESPDGLLLSSIKRGYRAKRDQPERPLIARLTLHAHRLTFRNLAGAEQTIECTPPSDFRAITAQLGRYARG